MLKNIILLWVCCWQLQSAMAQKEHFNITILQDAIVKTPDSAHVITLSKRPFKIQVTLQELEGVYLYAGFTDSVYATGDQQPIPDFENIPAMSMAEASFNPDQELIVSDDGWAYWFYNAKEDWHRFDKDILVEGKKITGSKSVKQFFLPTADKILPVADVMQPLYLFFFSARENKKHDLSKELQRFKLKLVWE